MVTVIFTKMVFPTRASGTPENGTGKAWPAGRPTLSTTASGKMTNATDTDGANGKTSTPTRETGPRESGTGQVRIYF